MIGGIGRHRLRRQPRPVGADRGQRVDRGFDRFDAQQCSRNHLLRRDFFGAQQIDHVAGFHSA